MAIAFACARMTMMAEMLAKMLGKLEYPLIGTAAA